MKEQYIPKLHPRSWKIWKIQPSPLPSSTYQLGTTSSPERRCHPLVHCSSNGKHQSLEYAARTSAQDPQRRMNAHRPPPRWPPQGQNSGATAHEQRQQPSTRSRQAVHGRYNFCDCCSNGRGAPCLTDWGIEGKRMMLVVMRTMTPLVSARISCHPICVWLDKLDMNLC
jgi:hypothetical protein